MSTSYTLAESNDPRDFKQSHQHTVSIGSVRIQKAYIFYDNVYLTIPSCTTGGQGLATFTFLWSTRKINHSRWWFQLFFTFTPIWGRFPIWLIFFGWVETTNQHCTAFKEPLEIRWFFFDPVISKAMLWMSEVHGHLPRPPVTNLGCKFRGFFEAFPFPLVWIKPMESMGLVYYLPRFSIKIPTIMKRSLWKWCSQACSSLIFVNTQKETFYLCSMGTAVASQNRYLFYQRWGSAKLIRKTDSLTSPCKSYKEYCHLLSRYTSQGNSTGNKMICCNPGPKFIWSSWCSVQSWAELGMFKIPMLEWEMVWRNYQFPKHNLVSVKTTWTFDLQTLACLVRVS